MSSTTSSAASASTSSGSSSSTAEYAVAAVVLVLALGTVWYRLNRGMGLLCLPARRCQACGRRIYRVQYNAKHPPRDWANAEHTETGGGVDCEMSRASWWPAWRGPRYLTPEQLG